MGWCAVIAMGVVLLSVFINQGQKWSLYLLGAVVVAWLGYSLAQAMIAKNFWLQIYSLFTFLVWMWVNRELYLELSRSYLDPRARWFLGRPQTIPSLKCKLKWDGQEIELKASRFDRSGSFLVWENTHDSQALNQIKKHQALDLEFHIGDRTAKANARISRVMKNRQCFGVRFSRSSGDQLKLLGDFEEIVRASGYEG